MPQLETSTYISQLFWLIVTFVPLYFIIARTALPRIRTALENRQTRIDQDLNRAAKLSGEAETVRTAYEQELTAARATAQDQVRATTDAAMAAAAARHEGVSQQLARDLAAAEERIAEARRDAIGNIQSLAQELAAAAASRVAGIQLDEAAMQAAVDTELAGRK
ncbi:MAG: F0F1 ATP synthase subunit B family protein [Alphaproteobacteria bacterium]